MTTSRRAFVLGAGASTLGLASGCARRRDPRSIRIVFSPPTLAGMYRQIAAAFERENPGVSVELIPATSYPQIMQRDFRLALVGDEPDVSHLGLHQIRFYAERGLAQPLDPFLAEHDPHTLTRHPTIGRVNGTCLALPFGLSVPVSYINRTLVRAAGHDPDRIEAGDWPQLLDMARAITRRGAPLSGIFLDYMSESALAWQVLVLSRGGRMMDEAERELLFDGPEGLWSARLLRALGRAGQQDLSRENARMAFAAGQIGCYQNTSSNIQRFSQASNGFALGIAPTPVAPGGRLPAAGNAAVIVTRDPSRWPLAWRYIAFACGPVGQTIMARATGYLSLNATALGDLRLLGGQRRDPLYRRLYGMLDSLDTWYAFPGPRSGEIADEITQMMRLLILGRAVPERGLAQMAERARALLPRKASVPQI